MADGGFNFSELGQVSKKEENGQVVHLRHPGRGLLFYENGSGRKPVTITVVGTYSETYRKNERERMDSIARGKATAGFLDATEQLMSACTDWDGFIKDGNLVPFDREKLAKVLQAEPWIAEQLYAPARDHERFFSESSAP